MSGNEPKIAGPEVAAELPPSAQTPGIFGEVIDATVQAERRRSVTRSVAAKLGVPDENVFELLRTVWHTSKGQSDLTKQEMFNGMSLIARFDLDPISREVYVTRNKVGQLMTIVGIDGWIKILNRTPHFDGFDVELAWNEDETELKWAETRIYSKERSHPTVYRGFMNEYMKMAGNVAQKAPWHMLRIFSLRHAARLFTPLGGNVVLQEEAEWMMREKNDAADLEGDALAAQLQAKAAKTRTPAEKVVEPPGGDPSVELPPAPQQPFPKPTTKTEEPPVQAKGMAKEPATPDQQDEAMFLDEYRRDIADAVTAAQVERCRRRAEEGRTKNEITAETLRDVMDRCAKRIEAVQSK